MAKNYFLKKPFFLTVLLFLCFCSPLNASIIVGGNQNSNITAGLTALGETYTLSSSWMVDPTAYSLGSGDTIILGLDGGTGPFVDYSSFLSNGGNLIVTGGSNLDAYRNWADDYFNITDTASGWHQDGAWHTIGSHPANQFLPNDYSFNNSSHTYHMLGFLSATPNSTMLGSNDESVFVAAFREYSNGGSFNYMALDLGFRTGDEDAFITPWLRGALSATDLDQSQVPEPATMLLFGVGLLGLAGVNRRKK